MKYTKRQITEAIGYWQRKLNESMINESGFSCLAALKGAYGKEIKAMIVKSSIAFAVFGAEGMYKMQQAAGNDGYNAKFFTDAYQINEPVTAGGSSKQVPQINANTEVYVVYGDFPDGSTVKVFGMYPEDDCKFVQLGSFSSNSGPEAQNFFNQTGIDIKQVRSQQYATRLP